MHIYIYMAHHRRLCNDPRWDRMTRICVSKLDHVHYSTSFKFVTAIILHKNIFSSRNNEGNITQVICKYTSLVHMETCPLLGAKLLYVSMFFIPNYYQWLIPISTAGEWLVVPYKTESSAVSTIIYLTNIYAMGNVSMLLINWLRLFSAMQREPDMSHA